MSEQAEPEDGRAAEAFRAALARHADEVTPDVAVPERPARRPGRWVAAGAALAVAASLVVGFALLDRDRPGDGALDPAGEPPAVAEGWRGVTFRDVTVQVPEEWGDASAPRSDWCADRGREPLERPFVDTSGGNGAVLDIGCPEQPPVPAGFGPEPEDQWVPHLVLLPAEADGLDEPVEDGTTTHEGWTLRVATVGDVQLRLLTDASTEGVAEEILASAQRSEVSALGCDTTSPAQGRPGQDRPVFAPVGDLQAVDPAEVQSLLVCQYQRLGTDRPGLRADSIVEGPAARDWVEAVQGAPRGSGPDRPENCLDPWESASSEVVHPLDADGNRLAAVYVTSDACAGNGLRDATTTYQLTEATCAPIFSERVVWWGGQGAVAQVCLPEQY